MNSIRSIPQATWAKLVPLNPDKAPVNCCYTEVQIEDKGRIIRKQTKETWILNISSSPLKIDSNWLDPNQEKQLFGGEMIALCQEKSPSFDYVFCFTDFHSKRENESPKLHKPPEKLLKANNNVILEAVICSICQGVISHCAMIRPCEHNFCGDCLIGHLRNSLACPVCESRVISVAKNPVLLCFIEAAMRDFPHLQRRGNDQKVKIQNDLEGDVFLIESEVFIGPMGKEGQGTLVYQDGGVHQGTWRNGLKEGEGVWMLKNGAIIKGLWSKDVLQKDVEITFVNNDFYKGEIKDMKRHGKGITKYANGGVYEGDWKEDILDGFAKQILKDGDDYEGDWVLGEKEGQGTMKYFNGNVYQGAWKNSKREGTGWLALRNGAKFEGKAEDLWNGNEDVFKGEWKKDQKHGKGVFTLKNGDRIEGNWVNDRVQPMVRIEYSNGEKYEGEVKDRSFQKHGKGVLLYKNGSQYDGYWSNDKESGQGKYTFEGAGRKYEEFWEGGSVRDFALTFANGTQYKAVWEEVKQVKEVKKKRNCK